MATDPGERFLDVVMHGVDALPLLPLHETLLHDRLRMARVVVRFLQHPLVLLMGGAERGKGEEPSGLE